MTDGVAGHGAALYGPRPPARRRIGASPSGKAADFDSAIRRFESSRPSQLFGTCFINGLPSPQEGESYRIVAMCWANSTCASKFGVMSRTALLSALRFRDSGGGELIVGESSANR